MMMWAAAATEKKRGNPNILQAFIFSSLSPNSDEVAAFTTPPSPAGKAKVQAFARASPGGIDVYPVSPPSATAKGTGKRRRRRRREEECREEGRRQLIRRVLEEVDAGGEYSWEEPRRRRIHTDAVEDRDGRSRAASSMQDVYTFAIEDELTEDASRKYLPKSSTIRSTKKNYGTLGVQTRRSSNQTAARKPNLDRNFAKRRKAHHEGSSLLHQKVNDVVLLDDEDVKPDEAVHYVVPDKWKELKIYYPPSDDPEAVELSSLDIRRLDPGIFLSSPVINYYLQYIKRVELPIEYGTGRFYMFNTYFYPKLQEALYKGGFLKLRRWWKGVNIFQRGYIIFPIHLTEHWSLIIVCMPAKESNSGPIILHLDSLAIHPSAEIFDTVGRYLEEEWRHMRKNPPSDISISDRVWQDLPSNIQKEKVKVPGQGNNYDCGVFMLYYIREFIRQAPERFTRDSLKKLRRSWFKAEDASGLRNTIRGQLLELFSNARVDEAAVLAGSDGESEPRDGSGMAAVGGSTGTRIEEKLGECVLAKSATLSDSVKDDSYGSIKIDSDSSRDEQDIEILPSGSSKNRVYCGLLGV